MDLIYGEFVDNEIQDIDVLQDYSFDCVVGIGKNDVNDFECRVQEYNNKCKVDNVLYIEFSEYGGIIDRIEHDSKSGEIVYKGRTWHGVMNSHVIQGHKIYSGEVNAIIGEMIHDAGMDSLFVVDLVEFEDRNIEVGAFEVIYEKLYESIMRLLQRDDVGGKLICYYYSGKVHLGAVIGVDYSADEEFDTSRTPYRTGRTENTVNHLICLGKGDGDNRPVIHLFTNDISQDLEHREHIQPYTLRNNPLKDAHYILDKRNQIMFGKDEICEIFDSPNSEIITNYIPMDSRDDENDWTNPPYDWSTQYFTKYYEDGDIDENTGLPKKQLLKEMKRDEYHVRKTIPDDWNTNFADYYFWDENKTWDEDDENNYFKYKDGWNVVMKAKKGDYGAVKVARGTFSSVRARSESELTEANGGISWQTVNDKPTDWETKYNNYYIDDGMTGKTAVSARNYDRYSTDDTYDGVYQTRHVKADGSDITPLPSCPPDWNYHFSNYMTRNKNAIGEWVYTQVQGVEQQHFVKVTSSKAPARWSSEWGQYYRKVSYEKKYKDKYIKWNKGYYMTASDAMAIGKIKKQSKEKPYPKYEPKKYYLKIKDEDTPPVFNNAKTLKNGVFQKFSFSVAPIWDTSMYHYYRKILNTIPTFVPNTYYSIRKEVLQVPEWGIKTYYYAVQDRYRKLVEQGIEKLKTLNDKDTLDIDLELDSNYDVLDVMGLTDEVTGAPIHKPILRKIAKIKKDILSVSYETD